MDKEHIETIDTQDMWQLLVNFPNQWDESIKQTEDLDLKLDTDRINNVCFAGMGGSAIGADLLKAYSYDSCPVPVQVVRHYRIPSWVDEHTLFVGCSFSGNTEETLSALNEAKERGAQLIGITSGGELMLKARKEEFNLVRIPGGMPPRTALGYSFVPLFRIFKKLGYLKEDSEVLFETEKFLLEQASLFADFEDNEALALARDLQDSLPVVYSDATHMAPVNLRWRCQFEENAKTLAYGGELPEMNHNEIVGWEYIAHLTGRLSVIMLVDDEDDSRVQKRMRIVRELIEDQAASYHVLKTKGTSRLTRMFSLIQMADWTSFYLAILHEEDPTPIAKIDLLKSKLAEE